MRSLEVYVPDIKEYVRYQVMDPKDVDTFVEEYVSIPKEDYIYKVVETLVENFKSSISGILNELEDDEALQAVRSLYNGCVMLNPGLDVEEWLALSWPSKGQPPPKKKKATRKKAAPKKFSLTKAKFLGLESYLNETVVGQEEAVSTVVKYLKRSITGLGDEQRPLGVFLFAGASGVGKSEMAKRLHSYLFGDEHPIVRIDCGEYQHKHENQKLIGSPPGYVGYDDGGFLTNQMKSNPNTVVLLDEVEKAHPDIWNTFLRVFDEGIITDNAGKEISFRNAIIIMTTNLGNREALSDALDGGVGFGASLEFTRNGLAPSRERMVSLTTKAINKAFKPEFLNRTDKTVVFNHLTEEDLRYIAQLELDKLEKKLQSRGMTFSYDDGVLDQMVSKGVSPIDGARGISKVRREDIEDVVSDALLKSSRWPRGTVVSLSWDDEYKVHTKRPVRKKTKTTS